MNPQFDVHHLPEQLNLTEVFLHRQVPTFGNRIALRTSNRSLTYQQLAEEVDRATGVFRGLGLEAEQRVLLMLPDVPEFASAWFATIKAGGVVAAVNPEQKPEEIAYYLGYTRAKLLIVHCSALAAVEPALSKASLLKA